MKRLFWVSLVVMALVVISCGKAAVKKVSEDSKTATGSFALIESIKEAYCKKDVSGIENYTTVDGFRAISRVVKPFDSAELSFTPVLVEIDDDGNVNVNVSWKGTWKKGEKTSEERGMAVFVLKGMPLKVDAVLRANPFKYPE